MSSADPTEATAAKRQADSARSTVRLTTRTEAAPARAEFVDDRPGRSPGPDHRDVGTDDPHTLLGDRRHETRTIRTGAHQLVTVPADRVHGAECLGGRVEPVDRGSDVVLVRHRHRQPGEPEHSHRIDRLGATTGGHVEGNVGPVDAGSIERRSVNRRRQAVRDRRPDERRNPALAHRTPAWRASSMLRSCCQSSEANTCRPSSSAIT